MSVHFAPSEPGAPGQLRPSEGVTRRAACHRGCWVDGGCAWALGHPRCGRDRVHTQPFALSLDIAEGCVQLHLRTRVCERREREPLTPWPAVIEASGTQTQSGLGFMAPGWGRGAGFYAPKGLDTREGLWVPAPSSPAVREGCVWLRGAVSYPPRASTEKLGAAQRPCLPLRSKWPRHRCTDQGPAWCLCCLLRHLWATRGWEGAGDTSF